MSMQLTTSGFQARPHDTVDVGLFMRMLRRRAGTILLCTVLAAGIALSHVLFATPQFTAQGTLYLGDTQAEQGDSSSNLNLSAYSTQSDVETQVELLSTGALVEGTILKTGLNADIHPAGAPKLNYWRWRLFGGGSTQDFVPGAQSLQVIDATVPGRFKLVTGPDNTYKLYRRGDMFGANNRLVLIGAIGKPASGDGVSLTVQPASPDAQDGETFNIKPGQTFDLDVTAPDALTASLLNGAYDVTAGGAALQPTKLAFLRFRWTNPYQAQLFVNQLMHDYIASQLAWKTEAASVTENFVGDQLKQVTGKLAKADQALADYQAKTGIVDPQQIAQAAVSRMTQLQTQESALQLQRDALQQMDDALNSKHAVNPYLVSEADDTVLAGMTTALSDAEVKLRQLEMEYTAQSPDLQVEAAQVAQLRSAIKSTVQNDLAAANSRLENLHTMIGNYRAQIRDEPAESLQVSSLSRSSKLLGQLYELLTEKAEQAQISKAATISDTRVVTPSSLPLGATSPKAMITVIAGAVAGFIIGIVLVLAQRSLSGRFESEEQIRLAVPLPVYGAVPRQTQPLLGGQMFGPSGLNAFSEAFKLIKRNIYRHSVTERGTAILVISAAKEDGKTTVAMNIAKALADDGKTVVLVDCDLYLSRLQGMPEFIGAPGLTDWLATGQRPALKRWPEERFSMLPAGTMRTAHGERLDEPALGLALQVLGREFDYVILDSPPLPIVSDGLILGAFSDLILSVVSVANTGRRAFAQHNELIESLGRPHGIIINGADGADHQATEAYFLGEASKRNKFAGWFRTG